MEELNYRILVTGSRNHPDPDFVIRFIEGHMAEFRGNVLVVGDCPTGVDVYAKHAYGWEYVEEFKADWEKFRRAAGPRRNREMVNSKPDFYLAFPYGDSRGTMGCAKMCQQAKIPGRVVFYPGDSDAS